MSDEQLTEKTDSDTATDDDATESSDQKLTEKVEITDEHRDKAKEMMKSYDDDRPTIALPGSGNTVTGTAVNEWVDDDGSTKFGEVENEIERQ